MDLRYIWAWRCIMAMNNFQRLILALPFLLALPMYSANLARIVTLNSWTVWVGGASFLLMLAYIIIAALCTFVSLLINSRNARRFGFGLLFGLMFIIISYPVSGFVIEQQNQRFLKRLPEYEQAVAWISNHITPAEGTSMRLDRFPDLANEIRIQRGLNGGIEVFFTMHPRLRGRLRGYAYNSANKWRGDFIAMYGEPKRLTNRWYRI